MNLRKESTWQVNHLKSWQPCRVENKVCGQQQTVMQPLTRKKTKEHQWNLYSNFKRSCTWSRELKRKGNSLVLPQEKQLGNKFKQKRDTKGCWRVLWWTVSFKLAAPNWRKNRNHRNANSNERLNGKGLKSMKRCKVPGKEDWT